MMLLTTSLLPVTRLFTKDSTQSTLTVLITQEHSHNKYSSIGNNNYLHVIHPYIGFRESEFQEILRMLHINEFYIAIDTKLNIIGSTFVVLQRCFIHILEHVAKEKSLSINLFMYSSQSLPMSHRNGNLMSTILVKNIKSPKDSGTSNLASGIKAGLISDANITCNGIILNEQNMQHIFMTAVNMYLKTYQNLNNLCVDFGNDIHFLPHVTFHS